MLHDLQLMVSITLVLLLFLAAYVRELQLEKQSQIYYTEYDCVMSYFIDRGENHLKGRQRVTEHLKRVKHIRDLRDKKPLPAEIFPENYLDDLTRNRLKSRASQKFIGYQQVRVMQYFDKVKQIKENRYESLHYDLESLWIWLFTEYKQMMQHLISEEDDKENRWEESRKAGKLRYPTPNFRKFYRENQLEQAMQHTEYDNMIRTIFDQDESQKGSQRNKKNRFIVNQLRAERHKSILRELNIEEALERDIMEVHVVLGNLIDQEEYFREDELRTAEHFKHTSVQQDKNKSTNAMDEKVIGLNTNNVPRELTHFDTVLVSCCKYFDFDR